MSRRPPPAPSTPSTGVRTRTTARRKWMFDRLAGVVLHKPRAVLLTTLVLVLLASGGAAFLMSRVTLGGYDKTDSEAAVAAAALQGTFRQGDPNLVVMVTDPRGVDDSAATTAGTALASRLAGEEGVRNVTAYWTAGKPASMRNGSGDKAMIVGTIDGDFDQVLERIKALAPAYTGERDGVGVTFGGAAMTWDENLTTTTKDITTAESLVFPLVLIGLVLVFGSVFAALVPLAVASVAAVLAMGVMFLFTLFSEQ